tara:strand:+ start:880 stop:1530 length:651 start_codon:yes stop_codon:yes gene_type:complete
MKLYDYYRSSAAFRVRIALNIKGIIPIREFVSLINFEQRADDYLLLNPQGLVPTLVDDDGTVVTQSMGIIEYLDETRPNKPSLIPNKVKDRAWVRAFSGVIACDIHPLNNLRVLRYIGKSFNVDNDTTNNIWYKHWIAEGMKSLESMLNSSLSTGEYCFGNHLTMADCCLIPQVYNAKRFSCNLEDYPTVMRINDTCMKLSYFEQALPENQPDANQ